MNWGENWMVISRTSLLLQSCCSHTCSKSGLVMSTRSYSPMISAESPTMRCTPGALITKFSSNYEVQFEFLVAMHRISEFAFPSVGNVEAVFFRKRSNFADNVFVFYYHGLKFINLLMSQCILTLVHCHISTLSHWHIFTLAHSHISTFEL